MILITGAAGFIASRMALHLNRAGNDNLLLCDDFSRRDKDSNWKSVRAMGMIQRERLFEEWEGRWKGKITFVLHLGARTDTTEQNEAIFDTLNLGFSQQVWMQCAKENIPLVYASSAATYGAGEFGFSDEESLLQRLQPLNPYGWSKHRFDLWALAQTQRPPWFAGLKFFNVYGPHESHKGRMASVVYHAFQQIWKTGEMKLFRSHRPDYADGAQLRDFIYVEDVVSVIYWLMQQQPGNGGIYNLGTGKARTFSDLAGSVFRAMQLPEKILYTDIPADIRNAYQYFTEARMEKLKALGYTADFQSIEAGIADYVQNYLLPAAQGRN